MFTSSMEESIQPMAVWMRFMGVQVELDRSSSAIHRIFCLFYGLLVMSIAVIGRIDQILDVVAQAKDMIRSSNQSLSVSSMTNTQLWNDNFIAFQSCLTAIGIHVNMLLVALFQWKYLWHLLISFARIAACEMRFQRKIRKVSLVSVAWLSVLSTAIVWILLVTLAYSAMPLMESFFVVSSVVSSIIAHSSVIFVVCLCRMAAYMFQDITDDISKTRQSLTHDLEEQLKKWKRQHCIVTKYIDSLNLCLGPILFLFIIKEFVCFISFSFSLIVDVENGDFFQAESDAYVLIIYFIVNICQLITTVAACSQLRTQVAAMLSELRQFRFLDNADQMQISFFTLQVFEADTKVTAMGLFEIDLHLFPKLIGTTLTYLIIFCQFNSSEKH